MNDHGNRNDLWIDKLMDLANYSIVTLVFSQLASQNMNLQSLAFGAIIYVYIFAGCAKLREKI